MIHIHKLDLFRTVSGGLFVAIGGEGDKVRGVPAHDPNAEPADINGNEVVAVYRAYPDADGARFE